MFDGENGIRAEEIIAEVYRQLYGARQKGFEPKKVIIDAQQWDCVREYKKNLGFVAGTFPDYMSRNSIFGLEIWYSRKKVIRVE